jgi:protein-disulfide isomerase
MNETSSHSLPAWLSSPIAILIGAVMISGSILYNGSGGGASIFGSDGESDAPSDAKVAIKDPSVLIQKDDPVLGRDDAPVTIVEFSDFQCPFCRSFWSGAYAEIKTQYIDTGKVRLIFRDWPLSFHSAAKPSALAANCAHEQGKFWQYHDKMFSEQAKQGQGTVSYGIPELKRWAAEIGVDAAKFNACLDASTYAAEVDQDIADGNKYGVSGTPSFFINGKLVVGAQPFPAFKTAIDAALQ